MTNDFKPAKAGGNQPRLSKEEYAEKKRAEPSESTLCFWILMTGWTRTLLNWH